MLSKNNAASHRMGRHVASSAIQGPPLRWAKDGQGKKVLLHTRNPPSSLQLVLLGRLPSVSYAPLGDNSTSRGSGSEGGSLAQTTSRETLLDHDSWSSKRTFVTQDGGCRGVREGERNTRRGDHVRGVHLKLSPAGMKVLSFLSASGNLVFCASLPPSISATMPKAMLHVMA
jgi:hypothetical protein